MHDRIVDVPTQAGEMETFVTHPEEGGPFPAVVIYMDFWGYGRSSSTSRGGWERSATTAWCRT